MAQPYPLFQSALSSTPFPGTMAETSTPTPADASTQNQASPYVAPQQGDIDAEQQKQEAERQERVKYLTTQRDDIAGQIKQIQNLKWSKHPDSNKWVRRQRLGLNGAKDAEPPEMMYARFKAIDQLQGHLIQLQEQIRLESQVDPKQALAQKEAEDRARRADVIANYALYRKDHPEAPEIPLQYQDQFIEGGYGIDKDFGKSGEDDVLKEFTGPAEAGYKYGEGALSALPPSMHAAAKVGIGEKAKDDEAKKKDDMKSELGGFTPSQLVGAVNAQYRQALATIPKTAIQEYDGYDFLGDPIKKGTPIPSPEDARQARVRTAQVFPGILKLAPAWVEQGQIPPVTDDTKAGGQGQKGLSVAERKAAKKAELAAKRAKGQ